MTIGEVLRSVAPDWPFAGSDPTPVVQAAPADLTQLAQPASKRRRKAVQSIAQEEFVGPLLPPPEVTPLPKITYKDNTPLGGFTVGIELTAMLPMKDKKERDALGSTLTYNTAQMVERVLLYKKLSVNETHRDLNCVEVSSNPMSNWGEVKKFYDIVTESFDRFGLLPHVEDTISGGGHIHVGSVPASLQANLLRDLQNRPYLNWVFNDPDDTNTSSYAQDIEDIDEKLKKLAPQVDLSVLAAFGSVSDEGQAALLFYGDSKKLKLSWFPDDKSKMVRTKDFTSYSSDKDKLSKYTFEFRFFQTPLNWEEQQAQLEFVMRYMDYIQKKTKDGDIKITMDTVEKVQAVTLEQAEAQFKSFIAELGLPLDRYQRMLDDNLKDRFKRGTRT